MACKLVVLTVEVLVWLASQLCRRLTSIAKDPPSAFAGDTVQCFLAVWLAPNTSSRARVIPRFFVENAQTRQFVRVSGAAAKKLQQAATERQVRSNKGAASLGGVRLP